MEPDYHPFQINLNKKVEPKQTQLPETFVSDKTQQSVCFQDLDDDEEEDGHEETNQVQIQACFSGVQDTRKTIQNTMKYPYSCIGLVTGFIPTLNKTAYGSGCLIGDGIVLTCAHNCYFKKNKTKITQVKNMTFTPALWKSRGEQFHVKYSIYPPSYRQKEGNEFDYAILILEKSTSSKYGSLRLDSENQKSGDKLQVIGYPNLREQEKAMVESFGECTQVNENFIFYRLPTAAGISGSPILRNNMVIGIHVGSVKNNNLGVKLTRQKLEELKNWMNYVRKGKNPSEVKFIFQNQIKDYSQPEIYRAPGYNIDLRQWVKESKFYPYSAIGRVVSFIEGIPQPKKGTGFLIGNKFIMTAAHNCQDRKTGKKAHKIGFIPSLNGPEQGGKYYPVQYCKAYPEYKETKTADYHSYDFAILKLVQNISQKYGYLGIDFHEQNVTDTLEPKLQICGIPDERGGTMWTASGDCLEKTQTLLRYHMHTTGGQAGSPIFKRQNNEVYVVGVHIGNDQKQEKKVGIRLKPSMISKIKNWIDK